MNDNLLELISKSKAVTSLLSKKGNFVVNDILGISLVFAGLFSKKPGKYVILTPNLFTAQKVSDLLASLIGSNNVLLFPTDDLLCCELVSSSKELLCQRLFVMNEVLNNKSKIVVTHASSLITPLPTKFDFTNARLTLKVGDRVNLAQFKTKLIQSGYLNVSKIDQSLQFASRGDILDIFSVNYSKPIRIEFFDDEIECIHFFDLSSQTSEEEIENVEIIPATDLLLSEFELENLKSKIDNQLSKDIELLEPELGDNLRYITELDYEKISQRLYSPRAYKYYRYIKNSTASILDYFDADLVLISNEKQFYSTIEFAVNEAKVYFDKLFQEGRLMSHLELYRNIDIVLQHERCLHANEFKQDIDDIIFETHPIIFSKANNSSLKVIIDSYLPNNDKVILAVSNKQQADTISNLLKEEKTEYEITNGLSLPNKKIGLTIFGLEEGFELPEDKIVFLSAKELFGFQNKSSQFLNRFKEAVIVKNYDDFKPGDFVVHEYYGIGKFLDIKTIEIEGIHRDFLHLQYAGDNILYVPLSQFRLVRKYAGREGAAPKLSNLNSGGWEKTKARIKERVNLLADRLYQLYSERASIKGFAFNGDDEFQKAFEQEFPYELTKDQKQSVEEIKKDMESDFAMDRLLCGDVGFGKTEVAFRAIFKAILSGKQAAILCPTTLLARQHYELALERFRNFGVNIAVISRLVPERIQKGYMQEIKDGKIHLVIGTHRLLNKDFQFKDLGLLVIDEEQRFGVEQKELIKEMKSNIDVLSLSATPIPRTLQLSLIGVRPVSQINTPPSSRSTIQTYVAPFKEEIARELIERELARSGQVFYIHNTISSIQATANHIQRHIPSASVGIVHGKMNKEEIEDVMMRFYSGEVNVLVATSIIENGIDVPNANLIIIEDADHFGLAQLYQIKGRVGRGNRIAYAYLFFKEQKTLTNIATKRLKAIQDFAELGSGYKISQRDLMIRGAGDILGPEQAGFIDSIGLDLYLKMLNEVIKERKTGVLHEPPKPVKILELDAYIPGEYASKEDKIQLYQEIENSKSLEELKQINLRVRDIYGRLPSEVSLLFEKRRLDILLSEEQFKDVMEYGDTIEITLSKKFSELNGIGNYLFEALSPLLNKIQVTYLQKVLKIRLTRQNNWLKDLETIVDVVTDLYNKFSKRK